MTKVDLITGFLGAGKTTFLRKYVEYLVETGERVCILENDYGAVNVDTMLLADLESDRVGIEMVAGGCDYDCHKRRFKTKLIAMAMMGYNRVLIEPSGVFDVDEFFDILHDDPLDRLYEISNVLTLVNASLEDGFSQEADYMLASQIAQSGRVILSHVDESTQTQIRHTVEHLNSALKMIKCDRVFSLGESVVAKEWQNWTREDFAKIATAGYAKYSFEKKFSMDDNGFDSLFFMNVQLSKAEVLERIEKLFSDNQVGHVMRVKGFLQDGEAWYEVNATSKGISVAPIREGQEIVIVIGEQLNEEAVIAYFPARYSTNREGIIYGE